MGFTKKEGVEKRSVVWQMVLTQLKVTEG